ncbi:hypothetical protein L7F22_033201 [Adiantum nelumboides]|nr:hypothetical protein [Adiantum nelumboides]
MDTLNCLSDENLSPIHEAINNSNYAASMAFDLFYDHKVLPDNWMNLAIVSPNSGIVHTAEWTLSRECTAAISKLLAVNAPLDQLIKVIDKSSLGKCEILNDDVINSQFELIIRCGRVDILIWLYNSDLRRQYTYFNKERQKFICKKVGELESNRSALEAFLDDVESAEKLGYEINGCNSGFRQMVLDGAPVIEIENLIKHQKELITKTQNLTLKTGYLQISFNKIIQHGLNSLETAVHHGHLHLIDWILTMPDTDLTDALPQIFSQAIQDGRYNGVEVYALLA